MAEENKLDSEELARKAAEAKAARRLGIAFAVFMVIAIGAMMAIDAYHEKQLQMMGLHHEDPSDAAEK